MFPGSRAGKQTIAALALVLAGCGGAAPSKTVAVRGPSFVFDAPAGWKETRAGRTVAAASGEELVSVTTFRLARTFEPALWPKAVPELDRVAAELAAQLGAPAAEGETVQVAGADARRYEIAFRRGQRRLTERIAFVLRGRREYQLLCRIEHDAGPCNRLLASFVLRTSN